MNTETRIDIEPRSLNDILLIRINSANGNNMRNNLSNGFGQPTITPNKNYNRFCIVILVIICTLGIVLLIYSLVKYT